MKIYKKKKYKKKKKNLKKKKKKKKKKKPIPPISTKQIITYYLHSLNIKKKTTNI
jgi:hypothetical protein